jgi:hypothetical protein
MTAPPGVVVYSVLPLIRNISLTSMAASPYFNARHVATSQRWRNTIRSATSAEVRITVAVNSNRNDAQPAQITPVIRAAQPPAARQEDTHRQVKAQPVNFVATIAEPIFGCPLATVAVGSSGSSIATCRHRRNPEWNAVFPRISAASGHSRGGSHVPADL